MSWKARSFLLGMALVVPLGTPAVPARAAEGGTAHGHDEATAGPEIHATFRIYGDAGFAYESRPAAGDVRGTFLLGALDFFATAQIEDRVRVLAETGVEYDPATNEAEIDLERLWGSYAWGDPLYFKLGREHSELSRCGRTYHHGKRL